MVTKNINIIFSIISIAHLYLILPTTFSQNWHNETVDENFSGWWNCIDIDSKDRPCIAYYSSYKLKYAYYDGTKWCIEYVDTDGEYVGIFTSLAIDKNDHPHIAYVKSNGYNDYDLRYAYYDGNEWHISYVDTQDYIEYCSIAIDSNNKPHIAYYKK